MAGIYTIFSSPIGELLAAGTEDTLTLLTRDVDDFIRQNPCAVQAESGSAVSNTANAVRSFLNGAITIMRIPSAPEGTEFEHSVWEELRTIPYGETRTYADIAKRIGKPTAFRAVANACGKNPIPLIIPCHRAIHKSPEASGFRWGIEIKRILLDLETGDKTRKMAA